MTPFRLVDAASAADAIALLATHGAEAQPIAAGGDLLGLLKEDVSGPTLPLPAILVNLASARDLLGVGREGGHWRLGAMATLADLAAHPGLPPMLGQAIPRIASPQLRARTTLGGNLLQRPRCLYFRHPDIACFKKGGSGCPAASGPPEAYAGALFPGLCHAGHPSDLASALAALGAEVEIVGPKGKRRLPLIDLYAGAENNPKQEAALRPGELLAAVLVGEEESVQAFEKIAARDANEFAWASAALNIHIEAGIIVRASLALGGIAPAPLLWREADALLLGRAPRDIDADAIALTVRPSPRMGTAQPARLAACRATIRRAVERIRAQ